MATDEVFMDIPQVETMAKNFHAFGDVLDNVAKAMSALSSTLKATAWLSLGATAAAAAYIDRIEPNVKKAAAKMNELSQDVVSAIRSYRDGDNSGSRRFIS
jgi:hypothetical protein